MKRLNLILAAALVAGGCGDAGLMDGVGDRFQDAVVGDQTTSTVVVDDTSTGVVLRFQEAVGLAWWNDGIPNQQIGEPTYTSQVVWGRERERVIQASRAEIAASLPALQFPRLVPEDVGWVTSQLVFDVASGQLDPGTSSQFGLWAVEPYSPDQSAVVVLRVGRPNEGALRGEIFPEVVDDGLSLIWTDGDFRYELFCSSALVEEYCWSMAESVVPLSQLLAPPTA
jgi:hypothetical protein